MVMGVKRMSLKRGVVVKLVTARLISGLSVVWVEIRIWEPIRAES